MLAAFAGIGLSRLLPAAGALGALGVLGIAVGIPVAVAVAILRHRLYDIDRLINRTLVYGLLTAILGLGYAGVVLVLGEVFGGIGAEPPSWAVAGATLAVAALFQPARRRFSARLRDQVDLDTLATELLAVTDKTMQPTTVSVWLRPPDEVSKAHAPRWDY
jgi:MFS family permease